MMRVTIISILFFFSFSGLMAQEDTVILRTLGTGAFEEGVDLIYLHDSSLLALGNVGGSGSGDFLLTRFDTNNQYLWTKIYGSTEPEQAVTVAEIQSGIYAVGGKSYAWPPVYQAFVSIIDSNGTELYSERIGERDYFTEVRKFTVSSTGEVTVLYNEWDIADQTNRRVYRSTLTLNGQFEASFSTPEIIAGSEGFELIDISPSLDSHFLATGSMHDITLNAQIFKWDEAFQQVMELSFSTDGNEQYNTVADHPDMIVAAGYTDGYNQTDKDAVIHKYKQSGVLIEEQVRGHYDGGPSADDEILNLFFINPRTFLMIGYTATYGFGGSPDVAVSRVDTGFYDVSGSFTAGSGDSEIGRKILPWKQGMIGIGYTESYGNGLSDILIVQREVSDNDTVFYEEVGDTLQADSAVLILSVPGFINEEPKVNVRYSDGRLMVSSNEAELQAIKLFDMLGRPLQELSGIRSKSATLQVHHLASQIVILQTSANGQPSSRLIYLP